ncbi:MAG TPA: hypothetical protein VJ579_01760 [Candidatus Paceibacterota bacterium]|nr:hypothetical protein [Candidatus Paceibacterota bacterium]
MTGPINHFEGLLAKYKEKLDTLDNNRRDITQVIKEITGVTITEKEFEVRDHTLFLHIHSAKRQVIYFKKEELLLALQQLPQKLIMDIK